MCTMIAEKIPASGAAKAAGGGWFTVDHAYIAYDHPYHLSLEHALNLDFVDEGAGPGARVAVELTRESARALAESILAALRASEGMD